MKDAGVSDDDLLNIKIEMVESFLPRWKKDFGSRTLLNAVGTLA
jgi:hypothetical protein